MYDAGHVALTPTEKSDVAANKASARRGYVSDVEAQAVQSKDAQPQGATEHPYKHNWAICHR